MYQFGQHMQNTPDPRVASFLLLSFSINAALGITNKAVLQASSFPWLLTATHAVATSCGCVVVSLKERRSRSKKTMADYGTILVISSLFTVNVVLSNISLSLPPVSLAFHQALRSTAPLWVVLIQYVAFRTKYENDMYACLIVMSIGVILMTKNDYYITTDGFLFTLFGVIMQSVKTITLHCVVKDLKRLSPLELMSNTCSITAIVCLVCSYLTGEVKDWRTIAEYTKPLLVLNCGLAFSQNYVSLLTNKMVGPLTLAVCANIKSAASIWFAIITFNTKVRPLGIAGMVLALAGSSYYSVARLEKPQMKEEEPRDDEKAATGELAHYEIAAMPWRR